MSHLKARLNEILIAIPPTSRVFLVDYPLHSNIGDLLIHRGTEKFFLDNNISVAARYTWHDYQNLQGLCQTDIIVIHGGGNFGDLYPEHRLLMERVVREYPDNRIVVLPQSVYFRNPTTLANTCDQLSRHPSLTIYVRDQQSLTLLTDNHLQRIVLMPDLAHYLFDTIEGCKEAFQKTNLIFRNDVEATSLSTPTNHDQVLDWWDGISCLNRILIHFFFGMARRHKSRFLTLTVQNLWFRTRDRLINDGIRLICRAECTHTDRLHVVLLALLLDRPVIVHDNSYGKLSSYYSAWLLTSPIVSFISK